MSELTTITANSVFKVGEKFLSYELVLKRLDQHCKESFVHYWRRDSRTVEGAIMKTSRSIAKQLKYYSVRYACVYGGQKYLTRGKGRRQAQ